MTPRDTFEHLRTPQDTTGHLNQKAFMISSIFQYFSPIGPEHWPVLLYNALHELLNASSNQSGAYRITQSHLSLVTPAKSGRDRPVENQVGITGPAEHGINQQLHSTQICMLG